MDILTIKNPLDDWDNMPLSHARILYSNKLATASTTEARKALQPNTWERWTSASGTMQERFQPAGSVKINCICIGAHNLGTAGAEVVVATSSTVNGTFTDRGAAKPNNDNPLMFLFDSVDNVADVRVTITGGTNREIGLVYAGEVLQMYQPIYGGHAPIDLSNNTEFQSNMSESGNFLGRNIVRKGQSTSFSFKHLDPIWVRERFKPFIDSVKTKPFFIKWRPDKYETVSLCYVDGDIKPTNMGGGTDLMQVSFSVRGHSDL
jgi:hypothetical protein